MLDPSGRKEVMKNIQELNKEHGITIILITHYMDEAAESDRIVVVDQGEIIMEGTPRNIFSQVKTMKNIGLDVPQVTELAYELKNAGINISTEILNVDEMVNALCQLK
jgi:energy-coupling factor transport system ATP-binding protein